MKMKWQYSNVEGTNILDKLLNSRGLENKEEIDEFLSQRPKKTYDPKLINGMDQLVKRVEIAISKNETIVIAGDYDMDGIGAVAVLVEYLSSITTKVQYYIPNRYTEGYGLSIKAVEYIKNTMKADLVITVDNGISCYDEVEYAKSIGLDIIVTDHHNPPNRVPNCLTIDLKLEGDNYPFRELCGCGLAFKICQALNTVFKKNKRDLLKLTDIVALSTIADVVMLVDENRTLVKFGLLQIKNQQRIGIKALCDAIELNIDDIKSGAIGFRLAPCFNASGRMEDAKLGVELLLTKDENRAKELAKYLKNLNDERRRIQEVGEEKCSIKVEQNYMDDLFLVIKENTVSEGVMGIIAGRLRDRFYKPVLVMTQTEDGILKASGRSIDGINLYEEIKKCEDLFLGYGGHANACGLSMDENYIDELRIRLNEQMKIIFENDPDIYISKMNLISQLKPREVDFELLNNIEKMEPFGMGNPTPIFGMNEIILKKEYKKYCGENEQHLRIVGKKDELDINGIGFSMSEQYKNLGEPNCVDLAFIPKINDWKGNKSVQLIIKDLK